ncbi:ABC transporter ATP-binding protein [Natronoglomus mannanivorans]|uniref:ABC transporter ATP-binding protein n=1 Tax=Natronoglomus mannanivorans TaxID=2979990 RepID=A0AAP2YYC7_9EURY|nr:ABC transporter ATP-binding protein [Halobacteria archaeon AArc-xg1-1]
MTGSTSATEHSKSASDRGEGGRSGEGTDETVVSVRGLTKTYGSGDDHVLAVDGVDFEIDRGTVVGLLGPNGAGKTTAIKAMLGLVVPDEGSVTIEGIETTDAPRAVYRRVAAMLEGARNVYWRLTVRENLRFFARLGGHDPAETDVRERHDRLLEDLDLVEKADVPVNKLSRGMKQKTSLACTLARETSVVFLDEPTLGLDVESSLDLRAELRRLAERESITIVLSSHDMDVVEDVCDRVIVMNDGQVVADDSLEELVDVFRTQTYRVTVDGTLAPERRERLEGEFGADGWTTVGDHQRFDATLRRGEDFYAMMDVVRESPCPLVTVTALEPDLEDVFLALTDRESETSTAGNGETEMGVKMESESESESESAFTSDTESVGDDPQAHTPTQTEAADR